MNSEKKWKVAVIGCGMFANGQYFPNIAKEANAVCVAACNYITPANEIVLNDKKIIHPYGKQDRVVIDLHGR